jgi:hypothetical protein
MQKKPFVEVAEVIKWKISFIYTVSPHSRLLFPGPPVPANLSTYPHHSQRDAIVLDAYWLKTYS